MVHDNTALVVLTLFTDAKIISVYTVYYLVIGKIKSLLQIVTSGIEAAFANMWVKEEYDTLKRNFSGFERIFQRLIVNGFTSGAVHKDNALFDSVKK